jgi:hypothetical protein
METALAGADQSEVFSRPLSVLLAPPQRKEQPSCSNDVSRPAAVGLDVTASSFLARRAGGCLPAGRRPRKQTIAEASHACASAGQQESGTVGSAVVARGVARLLQVLV